MIKVEICHKMIKLRCTLLTFLLLSLLHYINCSEFDDFIETQLRNASSILGNCSEYFQYKKIDGFINGNLTIPNIQIGDKFTLRFKENKKLTSKNYIFLPDGSPREIFDRLNNKQPISFRVDFPPTVNVPKLAIITKNDIFLRDFCHTDVDIINGIVHVSFPMYALSKVNESLPVFTYNIHLPKFIESPTCGLDDTVAYTPLIYSGTDIRRTEYPWLTAIYERNENLTNQRFICGGSLISSQIILSAAHCFSDVTAEKIFVMLGRYNLTNTEEDHFVMRDIETLIVHPEYKKTVNFADADLALLRMKDPITFTQFIKPICLWNEPADESLIVNQIGVVVGWGSDGYGREITEVPKQAKLNIVSGYECVSSSLGLTRLTSNRTLCAGNRNDSGPCHGDSGGGLMLNRNGPWMLRAVVSVGLIHNGIDTYCNLRQYTVFCDIAKHMEWLTMYVKQQEPPITRSVDEICGISGTASRSANPWLAAIYRKFATGVEFKCTGVLLSSRIVLTKANCMFIFRKTRPLSHDFIRIYLGRYDLNNAHENTVVSRDVAEIIYHPEYKPAFRDNYLVLLQMLSSVSFTQYVKPLCLWDGPADQSQIIGQSATLAGWRSQDILMGTFSEPIMKEVIILSRQQCHLREYNVNISSAFLCVPSSEDDDTHILMFKQNSRWMLRGVGPERFFNNPAGPSTGLYTDITAYLSWIQNKITG